MTILSAEEGCSRKWLELEEVNGTKSIRFCSDCKKNVHWTTTMSEAHSLGSQGLCIAMQSPFSLASEWVGLPSIMTLDVLRIDIDRTTALDEQTRRLLESLSFLPFRRFRDFTEADLVSYMKSNLKAIEIVKEALALRNLGLSPGSRPWWKPSGHDFEFPDVPLTLLEWKVLSLIAKNFRAVDIAKELRIHTGRMRQISSVLLEKYSIQSVGELYLLAKQARLPPEPNADA